MQLAHLGSGESSASFKQQSKVLIVEDEALFARAVMRRLQKSNYECAHVESVQDARYYKTVCPGYRFTGYALAGWQWSGFAAIFVAKMRW